MRKPPPGVGCAGALLLVGGVGTVLTQAIMDPVLFLFGLALGFVSFRIGYRMGERAEERLRARREQLTADWIQEQRRQMYHRFGMRAPGEIVIPEDRP